MNNKNIQLIQFNQLKEDIKKLFGFDVSYMKLKISNQPLYNNGNPNYDIDPLLYGGCWTKNKFIQVATLDHLKKVMIKYKIENKMSIDIFFKYLIVHELSHEIYENILTTTQKNYYKSLLKNFKTEYIETVKPNKLEVEKFCEYIASKIIEEFYS